MIVNGGFPIQHLLSVIRITLGFSCFLHLCPVLSWGRWLVSKEQLTQSLLVLGSGFYFANTDENRNKANMEPLYSASWWGESQVLLSSFGTLKRRCFQNIYLMFCNFHDKNIRMNGLEVQKWLCVYRTRDIVIQKNLSDWLLLLPLDVDISQRVIEKKKKQNIFFIAVQVRHFCVSAYCLH